MTPPLIDHFSLLAPDYDVALSDIWGVLHNGVAAFPAAGEALKRFRAAGGTVVLVSNSPRPGEPVKHQLERLGVISEAYDAIVTSGDVTRRVIAERDGGAIYHIGPERDRSIFDGLDFRFAPLESADYVVCSGLFDDTVETAEDYRPLLERMRERNLLMVCANPDVVVERGNQLVYCAGAIADLYVAIGGQVVYAGKPHRPIYDAALAKATESRRASIPLNRVIALGDSIRTDLAGAAALGIDCLFVTGGIHAEELGSREEPDPALLKRLFDEAGVHPKAVMRRLAW
jgi:HAD superfamily hydrolase (TIGR01459 family)